MKAASVPRLAKQSKVAVILRGVAGCGKTTEASKIVDLAQGEGLVAKVHAVNDRWWTRIDCTPQCKCRVQMVRKDGSKDLYICQLGDAGCDMTGRAVEGANDCMCLFIPSMQLEAELANLSAFMQDLESGCDVVVAENAFIHNFELYPYACAAALAGYGTFVVDMHGVDADTADANSRRVKHVYSHCESNREVIQRQMSEWRPVDPAVLPKQCRVVQCPYGKSKAHIVLAHIFTSEAFQRQPAPGMHLVSCSPIGQGSSGQTLAPDWCIQRKSGDPSPDGKASAAVGEPNASSRHTQDRYDHGAGCQADARAQAGEVSRPEIARSAIAQESRAAQLPQAAQPAAQEAAAETHSGKDGEGVPGVPSTSVPLPPSRHDPRLWPSRDVAGPSRTVAPPEEEVVCLISDSEDEQPPVAARQTEWTLVKDYPPHSSAVGPVTPQQLARAVPAAREANGAAQVAAAAAHSWHRTATPARLAPAAAMGAPVAAPARRRRPRTARKSAGRAAAPLEDSGTEAKAAPEERQTRAKKRRLQAEGAPPTSADLPTETQAEPSLREAGSAELLPAALPRCARQQQLPFQVHKRAKPGGAAQKAARAARKQPAATAAKNTPEENASELPDSKGRRSGVQGTEAAQVKGHISDFTATETLWQQGPKSALDHGKPLPRPAKPTRVEHEAPVDEFYMRHRGVPPTAEQKGKAPICEERKPRWDDQDEDDEELSLLMVDLSGAGIRSRFTDQKVLLPDFA